MSGSAPTGCYKCGRPGHWSRDCPSNPTSNPSNEPSTNLPSSSSNKTGASGGFAALKTLEKPKKAPRIRPKLTPETLLSNDGIGYVLRHFPRGFKYRGHGHEVSDLGNLLGLYAGWHSHLIPYYAFDQFVHKVEQVGSTKRVKTCLKGLRERVANGEDPTKLQEPMPDNVIINDEQGEQLVEPGSMNNCEEPIPPIIIEGDEDTSLKEKDEEYMLQEIFSGQVPISEQAEALPCSNNNNNSNSNQSSNVITISDEVKARMEANRLKALQRAISRGRTASQLH
ncbi:TIMELESS-interacting protein [Impatiens glandulifera]|uniref:TIMELESS-interacting protein n=1 Tax=Impatiens glandulifera TaxID=253017 RepID=UPI001FB0C294|nr:TIMELESS-interacting protein [Impatiens glandulifera]